jgi:hypothetical protein
VHRKATSNVIQQKTHNNRQGENYAQIPSPPDTGRLKCYFESFVNTLVIYYIYKTQTLKYFINTNLHTHTRPVFQQKLIHTTVTPCTIKAN